MRRGVAIRSSLESRPDDPVGSEHALVVSVLGHDLDEWAKGARADRISTPKLHVNAF